MLKDKIWLKIHPSKKGMLCMDCVEKLLGRKIKKSDIWDCFITREANPYTSKILNK